ncbi:GNAT family N-acetyltransferase [Tropicimonas aquimaris]|uniref:GNAT family N-acetyltransferase n=1 Tax=Tropicimonas aquimaris TaxID=914152 RepID=A0ABW3IV93_9RHOB
MRIVRGFPDERRDEVAALFWQAFSGKLGRVMAPERRALDFITHALRPAHAFSAETNDGRLLGVVGFKTQKGGLVAGGFSDLARSYGWFGALWRGPLLDLMERPLAEGEMLMDGIFVDAEARGEGVGSALIRTVIAEARALGMKEVRLDVIDINLRARALYERHGFRPAGRIESGLLSVLYGFHHATTMRLELSPR